MSWGKLALCGALLLACGAARAQDAPAQNSIKLVRVIAALPAGAPWLKLSRPSLRGGLLSSILCFHDGVTETWSGGRQNQELSPFAVAFKSELDQAGYKVVTPGEDNLFDPNSAASDLQAAAVITDMQIEGCMSGGSNIRGTSNMKIDWQIYSPVKKQVLAHVTSSGGAKLEDSVPGGVARLITESFAVNVRELASNADFRAALSGVKPASSDALLPAKQDKIALAGSAKAGKRAIPDAVGSVVTILTGSGSGSGDLVSSDGYMLTNYHVVGDEKQVRVRWSDGIETVAEVVRVSKTRDIALIKTNPRDREPLAIKRGPVSPGQRVYAIGSPLGKEYQGSVSSGVVSATRTMEGMRYIQSDVATSHGSSGGALLDENGAVIGVAVSGIDPGVASGLHFFIPIGDAMDFLNLEQQ
jgi:hypothetical protein